MTMTTNIQATGNTANQHTNKIMGDEAMNRRDDNINLVTRFSNVLAAGRISKFVASAALGLTLIVGLAMPGVAMADTISISGSANSAIQPLSSQQPNTFDEGGSGRNFEGYVLPSLVPGVDIVDEGGFQSRESS